MTYSRQEPWWYNEESKAVLDRGYLLNGETIHDAIERITASVCHYLGETVGTAELKEAFKDAIYKGWLSLSSSLAKAAISVIVSLTSRPSSGR